MIGKGDKDIIAPFDMAGKSQVVTGTASLSMLCCLRGDWCSL
jgi:hypothetical protein